MATANFPIIINILSRGGSDSQLTKEMAKVFAELEAMEADKAPSRAAKILCGLGFSQADQKKPTR